MIHFNTALVTRHDPRCIAWVRATASLWGAADDHDLDEPVRLTEEVPVRLRYKDGRHIVMARAVSMKTIRSGRYAAIRFYFESGKFFETEVSGVARILPGDITVEVKAE